MSFCLAVLFLGASLSSAGVVSAFEPLFDESDVAIQADVDEEFQQVFKSKKFPWYDKEKNGLRTPEYPDRPPTHVDNRHQIPEAVAGQAGIKKAPTATPAAGPGIMSAIAWALSGLLLAGVVALLVRAFLKIESNDDDFSKKKKTNIQDHIARLPFELDQTTGDFAAVAKAAYRNGDYRKAIVYLYGDVLVTLDQEDLIRLQKGKTNRQYLREVRPHQQLTGFYLNIMTAFEEVFFGQHDIDKRRVDECFQQWEQFHRDVQAIAKQKLAAAERAAKLTLAPTESLAKGAAS